MTDAAIDPMMLGTAPRPANSVELAEWARMRVLEFLEQASDHLDGVEQVRVDASFDRPDAVSVRIDLTGLTVSIPIDLDSDDDAAASEPAVDPADQGTSEPVNVRHRESAVLHTFDFDAHPVVVSGVPIDVRARFNELPFDWIETVDGDLGVDMSGDLGDGYLTIRVNREALVHGIQTTLNEAFEQFGRFAGRQLALSRLDLAVTSRSSHEATVRSFARLRWGIFSCSVRAAATVEVDSAMTVVLRDIRVTSWHPLVALALAVVRRRTEMTKERRISLADSGLVALTLDADTDLVLAAQIGQPVR